MTIHTTSNGVNLADLAGRVPTDRAVPAALRSHLTASVRGRNNFNSFIGTNR
ncbi:hypothetical protein [Nocardia sp. NPDC049707]|uniref:hypothetical protein n=1 Tax=Nocardia sp. NPDC049707 TaxID=3154735 RepID=UPI0034478A9B